MNEIQDFPEDRNTMKAEIKRYDSSREYWFKEGCFINEVAADPGDIEVSIARARVRPNSSTAWHCLRNIAERYIIIAGSGRVELGDGLSENVEPGDVVRIPADTRQRITNTGEKDLLFYVVCTPPFSQDRYVHLE